MQDEVDRLIEAWQRERPDLDSWEFDVLAALRRAGAPYRLSPGRLLKETLVTSGTMTNRLARLAARGLVERLPDPHDRRGVLVQLTDAGREAVDAAMADLLEHEHSLLGSLTAAEQQRIAKVLRELVRPFDDERL